MFLERRRPLVAAIFTMAAKEGIRWSSMRRDKAFLEMKGQAKQDRDFKCDLF